MEAQARKDDGAQSKHDKATKDGKKAQVISFVSFDGGSSEANRKAVRKQAALASAATRKATIAKKVAKQREDKARHEEQQAGPVRNEQSFAQGQSTFVTTQGDALKRKRRQDDGQETTRTLARTYSEESYEPLQHKRQTIRTPIRYLTPPSTHGDLESPGESPSRSATPPLPCTCPECMVAVYDSRSTAQRLRHEFGSDQLQEQGQPFLPHHHGRAAVFKLAVPSDLVSSLASIAVSQADPFNGYPVEYHPLYDKLLHHMLTIFAPRGWPSLKITNREGTQWEHFMTQHALAEPALFLVRVLFASGDLIRLGVLEPKVAVYLRALSIKAINEALSDPKRSLSDGMILAVGRIALTESLYGDRDAANIIHRPAQRRMINLRGGMGAIDFPPLVKRLMRWADNVMSIQSGTPRLLLDDEDQGNTTFNISQSVNVLEEWVPAEGKALRKKIAISDLIT